MKTRKVMFKEWIPAKYTEGMYSQKTIEGTGCFQEEFENAGLFHHWANAYEESSAGFGNYTVGLIEIADGTIKSVLPDNIKFIDNLIESGEAEV
jgi:hypothetical protein